MKKIFYMLITCMLILSACNKDDRPDGTLTFDGTIKGLFTESRIDGVDLYFDALVKTGLDARLEESTERTYFVPNNAAMQTALESGGFLSVAAADVDFLTTVINNHTVDGTFIASDLVKSDLTSLSGETLYISNNGSVIINAQATVSDANNVANNGVIHVVDFPILTFPENNIATIVETLSNADSLFTTLQAALVATGLDVTLASGEYTVFAPSDAAFAAIGLTADNIVGSFATIDELTEVLQYHVLAGRNLTVDLESDRYFTLLGASGEAKGIDITAANDEISLDIAVETTSDTETINVLATNGVVHIIDAVLEAEPYLSEAFDGTQGYSSSDGDVSAFYTALTGSTLNVDSLLATETEYTVIAPEAYVAPGTAAELKNDLLGHIFAGSIDLSAEVGGAITALNGSRYYVTAVDDGDDEVINGSNTISSVEDGEAYNGLWHMVDGGNLVPLPKVSVASSVESAIAAEPMDTLSLFTAALRFFELDSLPSTTYFYIENTELADTYFDAIDAADNDIETGPIASNDYDSLISLLDVLDASILTEVMNRHIVSDVIFGVNVEVGDSYTDLNGNSIDIVETTAGTSSSTGILVNDDGEITTIAIVATDVALGSNGVAHVLAEILPEQ